MKSYSPVDNVVAAAYPTMYVTGGLNDPRVGFWEPAKWVAKLRATRTNDATLVLKTEMDAGHGGPSGPLRGVEGRGPCPGVHPVHRRWTARRSSAAGKGRLSGRRRILARERVLSAAKGDPRSAARFRGARGGTGLAPAPRLTPAWAAPAFGPPPARAPPAAPSRCSRHSCSRGADRTWVVFVTADCPGCRPGGQPAARRAARGRGDRGRLRPPARAGGPFAVRRHPTVLLANRYGQVESRLVGAGRSATPSRPPPPGVGPPPFPSPRRRIRQGNAGKCPKQSQNGPH